MGVFPYELSEPAVRTSGVVFASPHSGRDYSHAFLHSSILDERTIRSSEDAFVDRLFAHATQCGAPLLAATAPRAYVDLNRAQDELDPAVIEGVCAAGYNPRVSSGLGVIPRVVSNGKAIYSGKIGRDEAEERIERIWRPYHNRLEALLDDSCGKFGQVILIDCHSMPHDAIAGLPQTGMPRPEVVLGDRFGASAAPWVSDGVETAFRRAGFRVRRNAPFAGAYVTQHYGRPGRNRHVIQIEIDRALYMNEQTIRPNGQYASTLRRMQGVIEEIAQLGRRGAVPMAAE